MRPPLTLILALLASPGLAWEVSTDGPVCILTHAEADIAIRLTYDPGPPLYSITLTRSEDDWPEAPVFALQFTGPQPNLISTDRHVTNGPALTVSDRGFGNVLDGLQFNDRATALIGGTEIPFPLDNAADAVAAFRTCTSAPSA